MAFRPRPWPTAITLVGVIILLGLGTWQIHRLNWKTALLQTIAERSSAPSVDLPTEIQDPHAWAFRHIRVLGRFAGDRAFWLYGRTLDGKAGIHLIVPLIRDHGPAILVDRGFVPFAEGNRLADYTHADGAATVEGIVREVEPAGWFTPAGDAARNIWYAIDPPAMGRLSGFAVAPYYVAASPSGSDVWPRGTGGTEALGIRNEHLNYAIFWYSMAAALAAIYVLSSWSRRRS